MRKTYYVYIMANRHNTVLYTGMTNDLARRVLEHKEKRGSKFTRRYNIDRLVYFEEHPRAQDAIDREKQIKEGSRQKKVALIERENEEWKDLARDGFF